MSESRHDHMARRRAQGLTYREIADEFGCAPSTAHRVLAARQETDGQAMRYGMALRLAKEGD